MSLEEHKRRERAQAIGLFRYQLICPALDTALSTKQRGKLVREIAGRTHTDPFGNQVRISRETLDRWIRRYRAGGFEALVPEPRRLAACTDAQVLELAASLKRENPTRTVAQVARILRTATGWAPSESTLLRHFHRLELIGPAAGQPPAVFGRFEAADPNELWVGDALHGPRVGDRKTYLFAFLDDHSRLATGYRFGSAEDTVRLAVALKPALAARGVPAGIYVDNGWRSSMRGCCGPARNSGCAWCIRRPADPKAGARSNDSFAPCANSSSSRSPTRPARTSPLPGSTMPPRCWSSTGCSQPGWKPNTTAAPIPRPGRRHWPAGKLAGTGWAAPRPCQRPMS